MRSIYQHFNCQSKEELYEKVKNEDPSVQSLTDFISFVKGNNILQKNKGLSSPEAITEYIHKIQPPKTDEMIVVFTNVKNRPLHICRMDPTKTDDIRRTLREGIMAGSMNAFLVPGMMVPEWDIERTKELFEITKIEVIDNLRYIDSQNVLFSSRAQQSYRFNKIKQEESVTINYPIQALNELDHYIEFAPYYATSEIKGLNILNDIEEIKSQLKFGFQHHQREVFGVLIYDQQNKVLSMTELFRGGIAAAIVDSKVLVKEVIQTTDGYGFAIFHNHPSGLTSISKQDLEVTEDIKLISKILALEYFDHFVVGKDGVFSFAEEVDSTRSAHAGYQAYIKSKSSKRKNLTNELGR